jgi:hypothetical protein
MSDIASLVVRLESIGAEQTAKAIDGVTASGAKAEKQLGTLTAAQKALVAAQQSGSAITAKMIQDAGGFAAAEKVLADALKNTTSAAKTASEAIRATGLTAEGASLSIGGVGKSASAASTSIHGVGLASSGAVRELIVLTREAGRGDFTRMAGSASILIQRMGLLPALLNPVSLGIAAVTGVAIAGAVAMDAYQAEMAKLTGIAQGVGLAVGLTADAIEDAARRGAKAAGVSISTATEQATVYATTGKITSDHIEEAIALTEKYAAATNEKAAPAARELAEALADPVKHLGDLNDKLHIVNSTQEDHIKLLAKSGDLYQADGEILRALASRLSDVTTHTSAWGRQLTFVKDQFHEIGGLINQYFNPSQAKTAQDYAGFGYNPINEQSSQLAKVDQAKQQRAAGLDIVKLGTAQVAADDLNGVRAYNDLIGQQTLNTQALAAARLYDKGAVHGLTVEQDALKHAVETYLPPALKTRQEEELRAKIAATTDKALKGQLTTQLKLVELAGKKITGADAAAEAAGAGRIVADRASRTGRTPTNTTATDTATVQKELDASTAELLAAQRNLITNIQARADLEKRTIDAQTAAKLDELQRAAAEIARHRNTTNQAALAAENQLAQDAITIKGETQKRLVDIQTENAVAADRLKLLQQGQAYDQRTLTAVGSLAATAEQQNVIEDSILAQRQQMERDTFEAQQTAKLKPGQVRRDAEADRRS